MRVGEGLPKFPPPSPPPGKVGRGRFPRGGGGVGGGEAPPLPRGGGGGWGRDVTAATPTAESRARPRDRAEPLSVRGVGEGRGRRALTPHRPLPPPAAFPWCTATGGGGGDPPLPPPPPPEGEESPGGPPSPETAALSLELQRLNLRDGRPPTEGGEGRNQAAVPHRSGELGVRDPQAEGEGAAVTSSGAAVTSEVMTTTAEAAAVTSGGQVMIAHRTDRRLILLHPPDAPRLLSLRSSLQGAIGLQRSGSLPRRRGGGGASPSAPRPHSHHGQGVLALQLDPESYSACLHLADLQRRLREAMAERERLLRAREARRAAKAPPPPVPAPPPPELDLAGALRARGHRPEGCRGVRVGAGGCRGPLTKRGGRIKTWRRRWFHLDPHRRLLAYYGDKEETKLKGVIYFQAIEEVYYDHGQVACKSPNPRLTFCLKTYDRLFCLVAPTGEAMRLWMDAVLTATQWAGPA